MSIVSTNPRIPAPTVGQANGEVLLWQSRIRLCFGVLLCGVGAGLYMSGSMATLPRLAVLTAIGYPAVVLFLSTLVRLHGEAKDWMVGTLLAADIAFLFGTTYLVVPPQYYDRALLFGFAILHLTEFYFGRTFAWSALFAVSAGYLAMIMKAMDSGAALSWPQELFSLSLFVATAAWFVLHYGNFKIRLERIVNLFERAEEGDFSGEYDVCQDQHPDSVTMVGRAYNRVRSQLSSLVLTDALSGCLNRRGLEQHLGQEVSRAARNGSELALIALDVDHFKTINDTFGHLAGDSVIHEVGELLRGAARVGDVVARTGGDEFTLLLPETNAAGAFRLATRIREEVAGRRFDGISGKIPVTVSIGIVAVRVVEENIIHDLHSRADEALYAAKDAGRNQVSVWTPNLRAIAVTRASIALAKAAGE
ncbi:MAG TPA: GGDEF domain-containing protein [Gemmatimonadaceae bacterium]|nr:GGDEF domain-containing protein [Gemmatimonadaceae bacterium]